MLLARALLVAVACSGGAVAQEPETLYYLEACAGRTQTMWIHGPSKNRDATHIPVFYRTHKGSLSVTWGLKDRLGATIADLKAVTLPAQSRRLEETVVPSAAAASADDIDGDEAAALCEDVFLSDGREPAELPDTWQEARDAYRGACEDGDAAVAAAEESGTSCIAEERSMFAGQPAGEADFRPSAEFCEHLARRHFQRYGLNSLQARRLKSSAGGSSGGGKVSRGYSGSHASTPGYGYTATRLGSTYPRGYSSTPYGYSGYSTSAPMRTSTKVAIATGVGIGAFGTYGAYRWASRASSSSANDCEMRSQADSSTCTWDLKGEELIRDAFMDYGFIPEDVKYPLMLTISSMSGNFDCYSTTTDLQGQEVFFSLDTVDEIDGPSVTTLFFTMPFAFICLSCCWWKRCSGRARRWQKAKRMRQAREEATPFYNPGAQIGGSTLNLKGTFEYAGPWPSGSPSVRHLPLHVNMDGTVQGTSGCNMFGKIYYGDGADFGANGSVLMLALGEGPSTTSWNMFELQGMITTRGFGEAEVKGSFVEANIGGCTPYKTFTGEFLLQKEPAAVVPGVVEGQEGDGAGTIPMVIGQPVQPAAKEEEFE